MTRTEGLKFLEKKVKTPNLIKHCLAVEAVMRALASHFQEDKEKWGLAGLLHDIDYEETKDEPQKHSLVGAEMLREQGIAEDICQAVKVHNEAHGELPKTLMEKALFVSDPITGLIVAATLVLPSRPSKNGRGSPERAAKKLADLTTENVLNRLKEKAFARGANREIIAKCQDYLNLSLEEFADISLKAMQKIAVNLEL